MRPPRSPCDWNAARAACAELGAAPDPHAAAAAYVARYPKHPPDFFTDRSRDHARRAFDGGEGWACRLLSCLQTPAHFSLHAHHLGLDQGAAAPHLLFDRANVRRWRAAILHQFRGPCRWRLQLGNAGRIHAHVLADLADGPPELPRSGEIVKPCAAYWTAAVRYSLKPALEYNAEHLAIWLEAKKCDRLPALSGTYGIPQKRTWGHPSRLRVYFAKPPTKATSRPRPGPLSRAPSPSQNLLKKRTSALADSAVRQDATTATAARHATTSPETPPRPRSGPLSYHRAPSISARPCKPSRPRERGPPP